MSEYYAVVRSTDHLAHYGVKGMKWGVRRYTDKMGNPNSRWKKLYGSDKLKPRTMQRHFNQLDKSFMNVKARELGKSYELKDLLQIYDKRKNEAISDSDYNAKSIKKKNKVLNKAISKTMDKGIEYAKQAKNIEKLQNSVAAEAVNRGYTVRSKPVTRKKNVYVGTSTMSMRVPIQGQKIKVSKKGDGKAHFTMYQEHGNGTPYNINLTNSLNVSSKKKRNKKRNKGVIA